MRNLTRLLGIITLAAAIGFSLTGCSPEPDHTHTWGAWQSNATQHWKECTANDGAKTGTANHDYNANFVCTVCGYTHTHSYATAWSSNTTQHWHECSCGDKKDEADHNWNTNTGLCNNDCGELYYELGDTGPGGGKIFYRTATGFTMTDDNSTAHYLEAAPNDMAIELAWASSAFIPSDLPGGTGDSWTDITGTATGIGTGRKNTDVILAIDADAPAAKACNDYNNGGKTDWFLPSKDELNQLYVNRTSVGNMGTSEYWSSSQIDNRSPWDQYFTNGNQYNDSKSWPFSVRAVRAF